MLCIWLAKMKITRFLRTKWQQRALFWKLSCLMVTGFAYNTLAPDWQTDLCNNATKRKYFVLLNSYRTTSTLYRCLVLHCVQIIMDHPQNRRERHTQRDTHTERESVFVCLCIINCREELLGARGSGQNLAVFWVRFRTTVYGPGCHLPTCWFSSSATTGMGENSPTTYGLQGSSLKTWVNFHPERMAH